MPSIAIGVFQAKNVPVLDIHEIVAGKTGCPGNPSHGARPFRCPADYRHGFSRLEKINVATLMIGRGERESFDRRTASPEAIGLREVSDITTKLVTCLPERYFDRFGRRRHGFRR